MLCPGPHYVPIRQVTALQLPRDVPEKQASHKNLSGFLDMVRVLHPLETHPPVDDMNA
jgi:hypothetical protein